MKTALRIVSVFLLLAVLPAAPALADADADKGPYQATSLLGTKLYAPAEVGEKTLENLARAKADYMANPDDADAIIWYGRRIGYTGDYLSAIKVYSEGIEKHPDDARLYRHRGHRYISIREFDKAIADYLIAVELIKGQKNEIEPDGAPNALGIPVSTKHGNIWYHLGLAYYLKHDFEKALWAYREARSAGSLPDNIVSTTHWIYMILRRLGRDAEAQQALDVIDADMEIIENFSYYKLCLLYKGLVSYDELAREVSDSPQGAGMVYGLANWKFYNGNRDEALAAMRAYIGESQGWSAFGFIAAEVDVVKH